VILTRNFSLEELYGSDTASRLGINNTPGAAQIECLTALAVNILQPLRDYFGLPVVIRSGFRGAALNHAVGGEVKSQHLYGQAADLIIPGVGNDKIWQYIVNKLPYDQVILEHCPEDAKGRGWVHVSYKPDGRRSALSCVAPGEYVEGLHYAA